MSKKWVCVFFCVTFFNFQYSQKAFRIIDRKFQKLIDKNVLPGVAVMISKKNEIIYSKGFGLENIKNQTKVNNFSTLFRIASVSKSITALAMIKVITENFFSLDNPINSYFEKFPYEEITLRQLATHTAGIRSYKNNEFFQEKNLSIEEGIKIFKDDTLLFQPGGGYLYSSYGYNLISYTLQSVMKIPFEKIVEQTVFSKLAMMSIIPEKNETKVNTVFYTKKEKKFIKSKKVNNYYKLASGGYLSTAVDLIKFGNGLLDKNFIDNKTLMTLTDSYNVFNERTLYGIGFQLGEFPKGNNYFGHIGSGVGGYSIFYVYPKEKMVIVILSNCSDPMIEKTWKALIKKMIKKTKRFKVNQLCQNQ